MPDIIEQWAADMRFRGLSPRTIYSRTRALRRITGDTDPLALTGPAIVAHLAAYDTASTRATLLSYVRCFYAWAVAQDIIDRETDPTRRIPTIKAPAGQPTPAPDDVVKALLRTANPRARTMSLLMIYAGLRCFEVAAFRPQHLARRADGRWWVEIPHGKGGKAATVPIPGDVAAQVLAGPEWDVTPQTVQKSVKAALVAAGAPAAVTPHKLRHYYATSALQSTQNLRYVQELMRHASPATTARYAAVSSTELSDAVEQLPRIT